MILQETMLGRTAPRAPSGYTLYTGGVDVDRRPGHGLAFIIRNDVPHTIIPLQTHLQAMAFRVRLTGMYSVCNLYISHDDNLTQQDLLTIAAQLDDSLILCGDFKAKHTLWGNTTIDNRGTIIENFLMQSAMNICNSLKPTHINIATGTTSAIDLTIVSAGIFPDLTWDV